MWYELDKEKKELKKKYEELMKVYILTEDKYKNNVLDKEFIDVEDMWLMIRNLIDRIEEIKGGIR